MKRRSFLQMLGFGAAAAATAPVAAVTGHLGSDNLDAAKTLWGDRVADLGSGQQDRGDCVEVETKHQSEALTPGGELTEIPFGGSINLTTGGHMVLIPHDVRLFRNTDAYRHESCWPVARIRITAEQTVGMINSRDKTAALEVSRSPWKIEVSGKFGTEEKRQSPNTLFDLAGPAQYPNGLVDYQKLRSYDLLFFADLEKESDSTKDGMFFARIPGFMLTSYTEGSSDFVGTSLFRHLQWLYIKPGMDDLEVRLGDSLPIGLEIPPPADMRRDWRPPWKDSPRYWSSSPLSAYAYRGNGSEGSRSVAVFNVNRNDCPGAI